MKLHLAALSLLILAGCADNPPSKAFLATTNSLSAAEARKQYRQELRGPEFAALDGRVDLLEDYHPNVPPCANLRADGYAATPAEQTALQKWAAMRAAYFEWAQMKDTEAGGGSDEVALLSRRYDTIILEAVKGTGELISALAEGKLTYCEFATQDRARIQAALNESARLRLQLRGAMDRGGYLQDIFNTAPPNMNVDIFQ